MKFKVYQKMVRKNKGVSLLGGEGGELLTLYDFHWQPPRLHQHKLSCTSIFLQGDEFIFYEDWGEQLVGKSHPVLCILDVESGVVSTLDNVPDNISPGQVSLQLNYNPILAQATSKVKVECCTNETMIDIHKRSWLFNMNVKNYT